MECRRACFGSALNLNVHLHILFLDGAYCFRGNRSSFHRARRPTSEELNRLLDTLSRRIDADKPPAPMSWMQRLKRVCAIGIETGPERRLSRHGSLRAAQEALPVCRSARAAVDTA